MSGSAYRLAKLPTLEANRRVPCHGWLAPIGLILCLVMTSCHRQKDVPYVVTPPRTIDAILELGEVSDKDVVYDLGSGDGRIVIAAARKYGARGVGIEIDPALVKIARDNTQAQGVDHLVDIKQEDVLAANISDATVVTLYLNSAINLMLKPKLWNQLRPGARVVSHYFPIKGWEPDETRIVQDPLDGTVNLYLWRITEEHARQIP
jgi:precorrin-6B methylase 2